jgi:hypothetical protein
LTDIRHIEIVYESLIFDENGHKVFLVSREAIFAFVKYSEALGFFKTDFLSLGNMEIGTNYQLQNRAQIVRVTDERSMSLYSVSFEECTLTNQCTIYFDSELLHVSFDPKKSIIILALEECLKVYGIRENKLKLLKS